MSGNKKTLILPSLTLYFFAGFAVLGAFVWDLAFAGAAAFGGSADFAFGFFTFLVLPAFAFCSKAFLRANNFAVFTAA